MGGLRRLGRLGGLGQVGVRAARAEMWDRWDEWDRWECEPHGQRCGTGGTSGTSGRASRKGVCKMFILRSLFAHCSLIVRLTFGERLCDLEVSEERKEHFRKERKFTKEMKVLVIKYICEE